MRQTDDGVPREVVVAEAAPAALAGTQAAAPGLVMVDLARSASRARRLPEAQCAHSTAGASETQSPRCDLSRRVLGLMNLVAPPTRGRARP
jgi:hypothetical protein